MKWTVDNIPNQSGRVVLVTGANSGLGYETALAMARKGAHVIMAVRTLRRGEDARSQIVGQVPHADLKVMALDLSSLESVRRFAAAFRAEYQRLDLLFNNAGVMAPPYSKTADGFEMQLGVNHLGHFALTGLLLDLLLATAGSRIINVTSTAHYFGKMNFDDLHSERSYSRYGAYGQSKLANMLFTMALQRRLSKAGAGTISVAAQPGLAYTNLQSNTTSATGSLSERLMYGVLMPTLSQSQAMGTLPQLYAATAPDVNGCDYFGPEFMRVRGYPVKEQGHVRAYNEADAERLWDISEQLTGVVYDFTTRAVQPA
jgi:NAD(P)-dependent dehydrogenase (short-subunit alcohol dehydrogenase family)